jgi:hypothetical protein
MNKMICIRLLDFAEPSSPLKQAIFDYNQGKENACLMEVDPVSFRQVPGSPFAYWISGKVRGVFSAFEAIGSYGVNVKKGTDTGDDSRFLRCWWEVRLSEVSSDDSRWKPIPKGGEFSSYYSDVHLVINYKDAGLELVSFKKAMVRNTQYYFKPGLTFPRRLHKFSPVVLPAGAVISGRGNGIYSETCDLLDVLAVCSSSAFDHFLKAMLGRAEHPQFDNGVVMRVPVPVPSSIGLEAMRKELLEVVKAQRARLSLLETNVFFHHPSLGLLDDGFLEAEDLSVVNHARATSELISAYEQKLNDLVDKAYGLSAEDRGGSSIITKGKRTAKEFPGLATIPPAAKRLASYVFGCAIGRYNPALVRSPNGLLTGDDVFIAAPVCCPATTGAQPRLFLLDDASSSSLSTETSAVLKVIFPDSFSDIEAKLGNALSRVTLPDYFRETGGFFADHLDAFSKSQRLAPIYWPLSTISGGYTIWIYYPELDDQSLPKLIADVLSPKIRILTQEIENRRAAPGAKVAELEALRQELEEMRADFLDLINRGYRPNQNDGVLITACPLAKYFRHAVFRRELEVCWKALSSGDSDWSHLAMAMWPERVQAACKKDRSIAIAHGREDLCPAEPPKTTRGRKKTIPPA